MVDHSIMSAIRRTNEDLEEMRNLHLQYKQNNLSTEYIVREGILMFQNRIIIPNVQQLKEAILNTYHDSLVAGHGGTQKTYKAVAEVFYWENMGKEIKEYVKVCTTCQQIKYSTGKKQGLLQPLPNPTRPWTDLTMDFIVGMPNSRGFTTILVVVDQFTKGAHFSSLKPSFTASLVVEIFVQNVVKLHEFPRSIVTNRDLYS